MAAGDERVANLWLADELWRLGAIEFGDFTLGNTAVHSPVYINLRRLISNPQALQRTAEVMLYEIRALQSMRNPRLAHYDLVAGIPFGGLLVATAFSLIAEKPLIYVPPSMNGQRGAIEGVYEAGQTVLIIDDLITGGRSIAQTTASLQAADLVVYDALVVLDRQQGGQARLKRMGVNLESILTLEAILHYLGSSQKIPEEWYHKSLQYLQKHPPTL